MVLSRFCVNIVQQEYIHHWPVLPVVNRVLYIKFPWSSEVGPYLPVILQNQGARDLHMRFLSPAQCLGYVAFILGVAAFVQKRDRRLKVLIAGESLIYALHFVLLGNLAASVTALISGSRSLLSLKTRSLPLALLIVVINVVVACMIANRGAEWLPVIAASAATLAIFKMQGIPLRLVLLTGTFLWLANNIITGSIGGTLLESVIAVVNILTVVRMLKEPATSPVLSTSGNVQAEC